MYELHTFAGPTDSSTIKSLKNKLKERETTIKEIAEFKQNNPGVSTKVFHKLIWYESIQHKQRIFLTLLTLQLTLKLRILTLALKLTSTQSQMLVWCSHR